METQKHGVSHEGLSKRDFDLIEAFEADYNAVDRWLRKALQRDSYVSFTQLVREYAEKHTGWRDAELLRIIAEIRNAIVHGKTEPYRYVAVPTSYIAGQLRKCRERLANPARAIPTYQRKAKLVSLHDALSQVLKIIVERD